MKQQKPMAAVFAFLGLVILIFDGKTALTGAAEGMELCLKVVIPSLFPFLYLCSVLTNALWGIRIPGIRSAGKILGIPEGAESLLISGFLGGYPAGAQAIGDAYRHGRLSRGCAEHLLSFCSNAGPAFLFGITAAQFSNPQIVWKLWYIQIISAVVTAMLDSPLSREKTELQDKKLSASGILAGTVKAMALICAWIILFRMLTAFLERWVLWYLPEEFQVLLIGMLELSNGCCCLTMISNEAVRFVICSAVLSFGGICVAMQTLSALGDLSIWPYLRGKITQTCFSLILSLSVMAERTSLISILPICVISIFLLRKKVVDFRRNSVYNASIKS